MSVCRFVGVYVCSYVYACRRVCVYVCLCL